MADPDLGAALCRAFNDYTIEHWLERDERVVQAILVAPTDPAQAVAEIRRLAGRRDTVAVHVSMNTAMPFGNRFYHPIWERVPSTACRWYRTSAATVPTATT